MSAEWQKMTPESKGPFEKQCSGDKERYIKDMATFNANKKKEEEKNPKKTETKVAKNAKKPQEVKKDD
jgi:hypothetical protein